MSGLTSGRAVLPLLPGLAVFLGCVLAVLLIAWLGCLVLCKKRK